MCLANTSSSWGGGIGIGGGNVAVSPRAGMIFESYRRTKWNKKSDALSTSALQKAKKLLAEDLNLEPSGWRFKSYTRYI